MAGPVVNFILAGALLLIEEFKWKETMIYANLLVGIFNLLPIYPLDGGRILKAIVSKKYNYMITDEVLNKTSNGVMIMLTIIASIGILYLENIAILFIVAYLWLIRIMENKRHKLKARVHKILEREKLSLK